MAARAGELERLIAEIVDERVAPLRAEIARLRAANESQVLIPEAAERLKVTVRAVQRWIKDGRLEAVQVAGVRMVRWPPREPPR